MEKVRVEEAVGLSLCHDITAMTPGFKGPLFKRGHVIADEDIEKLLDIGKRHVYVGEIGPDLVHEEDCAIRLAAAVPVSGAHYEGPSEGKVLLISDTRGMLRVDTGLLERINLIGDITIAAMPDHSRIEEGDRLASMRIVPLFTKEIQIAEAEKLCSETLLIKLLPYLEKTAGIIITGSEIYSGRIKDRFENVARQKLSYFPGKVLEAKICDDDTDMIIAAARELMDRGADLLVFSGGMSVDPDDLTPGAIKRLGADIVSYGVPSQPGNMTLVAYIGDIPVLGVPGAAIHLPTTVFDVLLPQIYTGQKFTKRDLVRLGEGGLCRMCSECHYPNCTFGRY
ncbi:MAG: molybdopterin-binding protein [Lachnospiraceae bacterium]|nr:molybdopterin-binding protein [Lachnospiraceae bacterium]